MINLDSIVEAFDPMELQYEIEERARLIALAAVLRGPRMIGLTASDLGYVLEQAVRTMGRMNKQARPEIAKALAVHARELVGITAEWVAEDE